MSKLSVIIVTKNEAHNIIDCLASVSFAAEIIVFDSGSTDNTVALCQAYDPKVKVTVTPDWPGDGPQKNRAIDSASQDWILCLDADERVSPALAKEMQACFTQTEVNAFDIPYFSSYCGKILRFGDWRNESHIRLFRRESARFSEDIVHCRLQTTGRIKKLKAPIWHHPFRDLASLLYKMNDYSTQSALAQFKAGKRASMWTALSHGMWAFFRGYCLKLGFLDGREGFLLAVSNAQGTYYRYLKLFYLGHPPAKQVNFD